MSGQECPCAVVLSHLTQREESWNCHDVKHKKNKARGRPKYMSGSVVQTHQDKWASHQERAAQRNLSHLTAVPVRITLPRTR
eukprot:1094725-Pelagomonas_calceolata.AAC.3